jgi:hypothetical protein
VNEQITSNGHRLAAGVAAAVADTPAARQPGALPAERLRAVAEAVRHGFPRAMTASELVIIDVDPRHIHAFWYIPIAVAEQRRAGLGAEAADAPLVLRIIEADGAALAKFDIEVLGLQGRYYVDIWSEARSYFAEIGYRRGDGSLVLLAAAPAITLPPLGPAADKSWRLQPVAVPPPAAVAAAAASPGAVSAGALRQQFPPPPGTPGEPGPDQPAPDDAAPGDAVPGEREPARAQPAWTEPHATSDAREPPPAAAVASGADAAAQGDGGAVPAVQPFPPPPGMPGDDLPDRRGAAPPDALSAAQVATAEAPPPAMTVADPPDTMTPSQIEPRVESQIESRVEPEPSTPPPATFLWMDAEPVRHPFPLPPSEPGEYVPEHHLTEHPLAAGGPAPFDVPAVPSLDAAPAGAPSAAAPPPAADTQQPGGPEGSAEGPAPLPLENTLSLSSFALGRETVELEINAELHIFGRTLPGRELHLFGRKVTVRPDGSFSISRPLPNGALIVSALLAGNGHREE